MISKVTLLIFFFIQLKHSAENLLPASLPQRWSTHNAAHLGAKCDALLVALTVILINHGALKRRVSLFLVLE